MSGNKISSLSGLQVLVVEDNEVNQKVTSAMLQHFGIKPDIAENGQIAIDLTSNKKYDLILMDCQMPVKNGFDTTKEIRENEKFETQADVVIIAMTANAGPNDIHACLECGMNDFIAKPVELEIISEKLEKWFEFS